MLLLHSPAGLAVAANVLSMIEVAEVCQGRARVGLLRAEPKSRIESRWTSSGAGSGDGRGPHGAEHARVVEVGVGVHVGAGAHVTAVGLAGLVQVRRLGAAGGGVVGDACEAVAGCDLGPALLLLLILEGAEVVGRARVVRRADRSHELGCRDARSTARCKRALAVALRNHNGR